jgi:hypothetical protein
VKRLLVLVLASAFVGSACSNSNPASPSSDGGSGAVINGVVAGTGGSGSTARSGGTTANGLTTGMTVSVTGTNLSARVDASNRFSLRGVPEGTARLQFSSATVNATADVGGVQSSETITLEVSVTPTTAVIESVSRSTGSAEQLEGRVESLPAAPAGTLVVAGRQVTTDASTQIVSGNVALTFAALAIGQRVHVKGSASGTSLLAAIIDIQNTNVEIPVPINGDIENFSGSPSAFQFEIDGRLIKGDATTEFFGDSEFSDIANGKRAEVKGLLRNGFVFASRMKVETDDDGEGPEESASIEGLLESLGALPTPTLVVAGTTVTTTSSTVVRRKGDDQELSVLALGMTLHVVGARQPDGSIVARMIQIKDDANNGAFEITGSAGGVKGTCPTLTFKVNGFDIVTDSATAFPTSPGCSAIKSGASVTVKGTVQGSTVKATSVEVK